MPGEPKSGWLSIANRARAASGANRESAAEKSSAEAQADQRRPPTGAERRRGQRVVLSIRGRIRALDRRDGAVMDVSTVIVNPYGALLVCPENLPTDLRLVFENSVTCENIRCRVVREGKQTIWGFHVPVEFERAAPEFWKISFPPEDWKQYTDLGAERKPGEIKVAAGQDDSHALASGVDSPEKGRSGRDGA